MKRFLLGFSLMLAIVLMSAFFVSPVTAQITAKTADSATVEMEDPVLATRFLNMLNHNYVYNEDFDSVDAMVNNSALALLDCCEEDSSFIAVGVVADYMKSMYGIEVVDAAALNPEFPHRDGYVYIIPRGYDVYHHEFVSLTQNDDGTFKVCTKVTVDRHDAETETYRAVSTFVKNAESEFGFNLLSSEILFDGEML